ncbi:TPA: fimbrial protein [Kluyvera ascorbata]|nr:fimbrial protein [Kluyvera ascorbata]
MNNRTLLVGMLLLLSSFAAQAHDGQVYVSGTIQANTCIVAPQSQAQSVPLGDIPGKQFSAKGSGSQPVAFVIDLQKCGAAASGVDFTFTGTADGTDRELLALDGAEAASGIGIELQSADHSRLPLNTASATYPIDPTLADNTFLFYARYLSTANNVTSGAANATATFTLTWQ